MKPVDVVLKQAEVMNFDPKTGIVEFRIVVNDGKDKAIVRSEKIDDCAELANDLFQDVRKKMKSIHKSISLDDDPLASIVLVRIQGDEELLIERLSKFFASIKEKMRNANMRKLSYYDMERQIKGLKTDLT
jgi:hypothetical protein